MTLELAGLSLAQAFTVLLPILLPGIFFIISIKKRWLLVLDRPMDFGMNLGAERVFGPNKNWRGAVIYVLGGTATTYLLHLIAEDQSWVAPIFKLDPLWLGLASCSGYVAGELVNSFIKRRIGIGSGTSAKSNLGKSIQAFFDNTDGAIAMGLVFYFGFGVVGGYLWLSLGLAFITHAASDLVMRKLSLKKKQ